MLDLISRIQMMTRTVIAAAIHHDMWSVHIRQDFDARDLVLSYRERYPELWSITSLAHRYAFYVRIVSAYDEHQKANTIPRLRRDLGPSLTESRKANIDALLDGAKPLVKKYKLLRNQVYAHQSAFMTTAQTYREAVVSLNDGAGFSSLSISIMNEIREGAGLERNEIGCAHIDEFRVLVSRLQQV